MHALGHPNAQPPRPCPPAGHRLLCSILLHVRQVVALGPPGHIPKSDGQAPPGNAIMSTLSVPAGLSF